MLIFLPNHGAFFNCTPMDRVLNIFTLVGWGRSFRSVACPTGVQLVFFFCSSFTGCCLAPRDLHRRTTYCIRESSFLIYLGGYHNLFVFLDDSLNSEGRTTNKCFKPLPKLRVRLGACKTSLSPLPQRFYITDRSKAILL